MKSGLQRETQDSCVQVASLEVGSFYAPPLVGSSQRPTPWERSMRAVGETSGRDNQPEYGVVVTRTKRSDITQLHTYIDHKVM